MLVTTQLKNVHYYIPVDKELSRSPFLSVILRIRALYTTIILPVVKPNPLTQG
jgi:hypothetical protein